MAIQSLRLLNFRSILDSGELRLRPITLLVGANDAGKSSLLHALAMLKQTIESPDPDTPLVENGRLVALGAYRQFVFLHETSREVAFLFHLDGMARDPEKVRAAIGFGYSVRRKSAYLRRFELGELEQTPLLSVRGDSAGRIEHAETTGAGEPATEPRILGHIERRRCFYGLVPAWSRWGEEAGRPITEFAGSPRFFHRCCGAVESTEAALRSLAYLGPERAPAPTVAHIGGNPLPDVGARGENLGPLLHVHRYGTGAAPALRYAADWLERLGLGRHLRLVPIEEHLYEFTIEDRETGLVMNVSESGRAVRQLLPLLVQSSLSPAESTLLLEEPETGLHPRLQRAVADILTESARGGRRLLVETYSESLMGRLLQQVREGSLPPDSLGIYFVQKIDGVSQFAEVAVEPDGKLTNWPVDFWSAVVGTEQQ